MYEYASYAGIPSETCNAYTAVASVNCSSMHQCFTCSPEGNHTCTPVADYVSAPILSSKPWTKRGPVAAFCVSSIRLQQCQGSCGSHGVRLGPRDLWVPS